MTSATASAPGKLILLGEHAVVYGHPCIVTAVDLRIRVTVAALPGSQVIIHVPAQAEPFVTSIAELQLTSRFPAAVRYLALAVKRFWEHVGGPFGVEITTESGFGASYGLGSSSAVTVAAIKSLAAAIGQELGADSVFALSRQVVLEAQEGFSSGFDVAAATYGGTLLFVTGGKVIAPLAVGEMPLVVGYTGIKADTAECIKRVARRRQRFPLLVNAIMESIAPLVQKARAAIEQEDLAELGRLMNVNQNWLEALGVSTPELDRLVHAARLAGAYGAKLSGAGGGDCMIALADGQSRPKVEQAIEGAGVPGARVIRVRAGAEGVRIDE
jgi:mevalonate kinase